MQEKMNDILNTANEILMEYWPLNAFIATNPLWGLRNNSFFEVISHPLIKGLMEISYYQAQYRENKITTHDVQQAIKLIENRALNESQAIAWIEESFKTAPITLPSLLLAEQIEEYQFQKPIVWIKEKILVLLRDYFGLRHYQHTHLLQFWHDQEHCITPENLLAKPIETSIAELLTKLKIPKTMTTDYLQAIYLQIYGWASLMNWRNHHSNNPWIPGEDACEIILLMWLFYEYKISADHNITYQCQDSVTEKLNQKKSLRQCYIWQTAFELHHSKQLDSKINKNFSREPALYDGQFIFCIDTRSEGLRRHLEAQGKYQTFGFAGFFGAIFNLKDDDTLSYQAPALVEACCTLTTQKKTSTLDRLISHFKNIVSDTKKQLTAPFGLFEMLGFWFLFFMLFKMVQPKLKTKQKKNIIKIHNNFSEEQQIQAASTLLTSIGLVKNFSRHVFICAHQSDNINNPFKSALNCGACGGNSGIPNALLICNILNNKNIRATLKAKHIIIPEDTKFIPACHHTGYDRLEALSDTIPPIIQQAIDAATKNLRQEKAQRLPGYRPLSERETSWSELIPELGLINNAAIIIGPRELTLNQPLEQRTFLHSYEPTLDTEGNILTTILSAPAIVAHWISSQYYFSTVNPELFGAGNKTIHNVLPGMGVLEGNLSDLKIGLPLQSTHFQSKPLHEPRRIIVVVYAYQKILDTAIQNSPAFKALLDNQWIYLKHIEAKENDH